MRESQAIRVGNRAICSRRARDSQNTVQALRIDRSTRENRVQEWELAVALARLARFALRDRVEGDDDFWVAGRRIAELTGVVAIACTGCDECE